MAFSREHRLQGPETHQQSSMSCNNGNGVTNTSHCLPYPVESWFSRRWLSHQSSRSKNSHTLQASKNTQPKCIILHPRKGNIGSCGSSLDAPIEMPDELTCEPHVLRSGSPKPQCPLHSLLLCINSRVCGSIMAMLQK